MNYKNLYILLDQQGKTLKKLAGYMNMTINGVIKAINNNDFKASSLIKIASFFDITIYELIAFLNNDQNLNVSDIESKYNLIIKELNQIQLKLKDIENKLSDI